MLRTSDMQISFPHLAQGPFSVKTFNWTDLMRNPTVVYGKDGPVRVPRVPGPFAVVVCFNLTDRGTVWVLFEKMTIGDQIGTMSLIQDGAHTDFVNCILKSFSTDNLCIEFLCNLPLPEGRSFSLTRFTG